ncbi:fumarylacetoacetate hydrolase family protein [Bacterioplanoides sp. SCSIO 12839]|uniref:fumarylacetoacetate hydrolase family protein n=1 Tax=Bacterioplanoides sp. SCSIO 12839 TaxID=2829569 RepID=UPI002105C173|nr:fumarylacetoacetate hydrolase family protein [Bacterioplanoides sp. SCSIO 12839]UTW47269.1 fumarylacetoacetate hydrolase family protein [Bacterioplanoides sp. SCSIO 12839]
MPCHIARYRNSSAGETGWAVVSDGFYKLEGHYPDTRALINEGREQAFHIAADSSAYQSQKLDDSDIELLSPITTPCRVICQGSNYPQSRAETGMDPYDRSFNTLFHKSDASISEPNTDIVIPSHIKLLDYEIEMAVVVGKDIQQPVTLNANNIGDYVAGIVMVHDVTARDVQLPQVQYFKGKSYRTFGPTGPYLCLLNNDEMHYLSEMNLTLSLNDELRQTDQSGNMLFKPPETLSELSEITHLSTGDIVLTGSPGGAAMTVPPAPLVKLLGLLPEKVKWKAFVKKQSGNPRYLKEGDKVESRIVSQDGKIDLGVQRNRVRAG